MNGQTTRKLVKIALLILYQTNLRTQKSNDHLITYLITDYGINQYVAEIALFRGGPGGQSPPGIWQIS